MTISVSDYGLALEREIAHGQSLPHSWYRDADMYERELDRIFDHGWQYAGSVDRVPKPGCYFTTWIARMPVLIVRGQDDELRAFANVCPHRGHAVAAGAGCRGTLQCPYHGWTFNLDGRLRKAPRTDQDPGFEPSDVGLRELSLASWGPLIFVSPDPRVSFSETTHGLQAAAARRGLDLNAHPRRASREWELRCNWKVTLDNNTECYHCATIHRSFASEYHVDRDHYLVEAFDHAFTHESPLKRSASSGAPDFHLYYVWPNFMLSARRDEYFYVYHYRPLGPRATLQMNDYFFPSDWSDEKVQTEIEEISVIMREDWTAFHSVQLGIDSGALERGIVLPHEEALLCHFQKMHARALAV